MNWINVEDRLPESYEDSRYLLLWDGKRTRVGSYQTDYDVPFFHESYTGHYFEPSEVTHWMPFPDGPQCATPSPSPHTN